MEVTVLFNFIELTNKNYIFLYLLISHHPHCMQPLDVSIFQLYKHWNDTAFQKALLKFKTKYKVPQFLADYTKIQNNIFKKDTIRHTFQKSKM